MVRSHPLEPQPYTGVTAIVSGEIAEDLTNYLAESEQVGGAGRHRLESRAGLGGLAGLEGCRMHGRCAPHGSEVPVARLLPTARLLWRPSRTAAPRRAGQQRRGAGRQHQQGLQRQVGGRLHGPGACAWRMAQPSSAQQRSAAPGLQVQHSTPLSASPAPGPCSTSGPCSSRLSPTPAATPTQCTPATLHPPPTTQVLPFCSDETLEALERNLSGLPSMTQMLNSGLSPQDITDRILADIGAIAEVRGSACWLAGSGRRSWVARGQLCAACYQTVLA